MNILFSVNCKNPKDKNDHFSLNSQRNFRICCENDFFNKFQKFSYFITITARIRPFSGMFTDVNDQWIFESERLSAIFTNPNFLFFLNFVCEFFRFRNRIAVAFVWFKIWILSHMSLFVRIHWRSMRKAFATVFTWILLQIGMTYFMSSQGSHSQKRFSCLKKKFKDIGLKSYFTLFLPHSSQP